MICDTIGLTADSYASMYVHGGSEVAEVYGGINYADPIFYKSQTMTGSAPLVFDSYPGGLTDYTILGNSYQNGTPTPDDPVEVVSVGEKTENLFNISTVTIGKYINAQGVETNSTAIQPFEMLNHTDYIEIQPNADYTYHYKYERGATNMIALCWFDASKSLISRITKNVLAGDKEYTLTSTSPANAAFCIINFTGYTPNASMELSFNSGSTALPYEPYGYYKLPLTCGGVTQNIYLDEPLRKQLDGDAADALNYATQMLTRRVDASCDPMVTPTTESVALPQIQTISGVNTLSVGTTVQPSSVSITGHIKPSSIYGNLTDVNGTYIKDKDGVQIKVTG